MAWGDYDNDGDLDLFLIGYNQVEHYISGIFRNEGSSGLTEQLSMHFTNVDGGSIAWGDYDNDGDLDIFLAGDVYSSGGSGPISKIYRNNNTTPNSPPSIPSNLQAVVNGNDVNFNWDKSTDSETPQNGLTYNIVIGTSPGTCDILSPMSDINTGTRRIVSMGNAGHCNSKTIKGLPDGQYYWSLQAIDNNFAGSSFSTTKSFTIGNVSSQFTEQTSVNLPGSYFGWWGDYDNDSDLDMLLLTNPGAKIYRNKGDNTFELAVPLTDIGYSSAAWGDYDNDGDLDILITGGGYASKIYRNNGNDIFEEQTVSLTAVSYGSTAWGDYNNDGKPDILLTGESSNGLISKIYRNNGDNTFEEETSASLTGVDGSSVAWGDYDKDGDLDILIAGESASGPITKIYRNNGDNTFTEQASLTGVSDCSVAWGDYDNDGYLDILLSGNSSGGPISKIYRNNENSTFEEQAISLTNVSASFAAWGDYDNDGNLDIILTGYSGGVPVSKIYRNKGNNTFEEQSFDNLAGVSGQAVWGDYDNDGNLDLFLAGDNGSNAVSKIYHNNNETTNILPSVPSKLQTVVNGNNITFNWDKSTDNETPQNGLKYNLVIGTSPNSVDILSPMSDRTTGYRKVLNLGNTNHNTSWTVKGLSEGKYYWSVQAIDNCFAGSMFSETQTFEIGTGLSASIKVFLQGPYSLGSMSTVLNSFGILPGNQPYNIPPWNYSGKESVASDPHFFENNRTIVDWVLLELRTATEEGNPRTATQIEAQRAAFLKSDGTIVDLDGTSPVDFWGIPAGSYYIIVRHRNHLAIMSHNPVSLPNSSAYDFTTNESTDADKYYGTTAGAVELGTGTHIWGMVAGDGNGNGEVQITNDSENIWKT